jgi:hypothetical protein
MDSKDKDRDRDTPISFDEYTADSGFRYENVEMLDGRTVRVGSVSSADIIRWFEENDDPILRKFSGLRLLAKCWINPDGTRIGDGLLGAAREAMREAAVERLKLGDSRENGRLVARCLEMNGLRVVRKGAPLPNDSSEAPQPTTGASPIDSPLQPIA